MPGKAGSSEPAFVLRVKGGRKRQETCRFREKFVEIQKLTGLLRAV